MVYMESKEGSAYKVLKILFEKDFKPEMGYPMRIPLIGNHATIDQTTIYWDWESVHVENTEEAELVVYSNGIEIVVNGEIRALIRPRHLKRLLISVQGGIFQNEDYTEPYYLYFGSQRKDFY